ncbi:unnamed protein product, partial [marine sediment metagenome]
RGQVSLNNDNWAQMTGWNMDDESHDDASITDNKFNLTRGVYKVSLQWIQVSASSSKGKVRSALNGTGFFQFPSTPTVNHTTKVMDYYFDPPYGVVGGWEVVFQAESD